MSRVVIREVEEDDAVLSALRSRLGCHGDDLIYHDLLVFERRLGSDALDAAWKAAPLVFHDRRLVDTADDIIRPPPHLVRVPHDFSKNITAVLRRHPGPVAFFGVDSSACPGPELLAEWVDLLSDKSVYCLAMVNISQSEKFEFPLHRLRGDGTLTSLALGFFSLQETLPLTLREYPEATFGSLTTLTLVDCAIHGEALASVICKCRVLSTLKILGSDLTAGCDARGLTISVTLTTLELGRCTATAMTLNTPHLQLLTLGVSPSTDSKHPWVGIHLTNANTLRQLDCLMLHQHYLTFETIYNITVLFS